LQRTKNHEFGEKMDCADFKQSYMELQVKKLGPRGLDGNLKERRIGWDNKCWLMLNIKGLKMQNIEGTRIWMKSPVCRLQRIIY
jgi:hypothetical protein